MIVLFEGYTYGEQRLRSILPRRFIADGKAAAVGYMYSTSANDVVFILPKVFREGDKAFGRYNVDELCDSEKVAEYARQSPPLFRRIFELSVWHYQSLQYYQDRQKTSKVPQSGELRKVLTSRGEDGKTLLDITLALIDFAKKHRHLIAFRTIVQHAGYRKIHWAKTISRSTPYVHEGKPYYLDLHTKQRAINREEELIILFYSVLRYLRERFHFLAPIDFNYELLPTEKVEHLLYSGLGRRHLLRIRGQYFSAEFVKLWKLLYLFFDWYAQMRKGTNRDEEYLLARSYHVIWEDMVDRLLGADREIKTLKYRDGRRYDHAYTDEDLFGSGFVYYIADSKYYEIGEAIDPISIEKQFTYARSAIDEAIRGDMMRMHFDQELTEGYHPIPNFFIRGYLPDACDSWRWFDDEQLMLELEQDYEAEERRRHHFDDRLFDRDTLFLMSYRINYLFVLASYVRRRHDNELARMVRRRFRQRFRTLIGERYDIYQLEYADGQTDVAVEKHFKQLAGKLFLTKGHSHLYIALEKPKAGDRPSSHSLPIEFADAKLWYPDTTP